MVDDESDRERRSITGPWWSARACVAAAFIVIVSASSVWADDGGVPLIPVDGGVAAGTQGPTKDLMGSLRASRELLERAARENVALPDDASLKRALGVPNLVRTTLRERGNAIRIALYAVRAAAGGGSDGGTLDDGDLDGGTADGGGAVASPDEMLLNDALVVIKKIIAVSEAREREAVLAREKELRAKREQAAIELREAEAAREAALLNVQRARTARLEAHAEHTARIAGFTADLARARGELVESIEATEQELDQARADGLSARDEALDIADVDVKAALWIALARERVLLEKIDTIRARKRARADALSAAAEEVLVIAKERGSTPVVEDERESLTRLEASVRTAEAELDEVLRTAAREESDVLRETLAVVEAADEVRLLLQSKAPVGVRADLYSLSDLAVENLSVSLLHMVARVRVHVEHRSFVITHPDETRANIVELGRFVFSFGWGLLLIVFAFVLWRRFPVLWPRVRAAVTKRATTRESARIAAFALDIVEAVAARAYLIAVVIWIHDSINDAAPQPETDIVIEIVLWVLWYKLLAEIVHFVILRLTRNHVTLTAVVRLSILRSVRIVLRYVVTALALLSFLRDLVGYDVLYYSSRVVVLLAALPVALSLLLRWRETIIADYVAHRPSTRLAQMFAENPSVLWRTVLSFGALASVTAGAVVVFGRDFVLGFEQTRKALAYLFRLRIERQAKSRGRVPFDIDALPRPLIEACADKPLDGDVGLVHTRVESAIAEAVETLAVRRGRSLLVDAALGVGLSTWLLQLHRAAREREAETRQFQPCARVTSPEDLVRALATSIDPDGAAHADIEVLVTRILQLELDLITVDGLEWLFLRELDGYRALDALFDIISRTRHRVSWVLGSSDTTVEFLSHTRRINALVSYRHTLPAWSENEIRSLLLDRQRRSGLAITYDELLVHGLDIASSEVVETEEGYTRLLWNFADGNPRVAQHFWLRSLVVKSEHEVTVRLYDAPSPDDLEVLPKGERFMLLSTVLHRRLLPGEISRTCRLPLGSVEAHVSRGLDLGFYEMNDAGTVAVTTPWLLAVHRYLRRKNLV